MLNFGIVVGFAALLLGLGVYWFYPREVITVATDNSSSAGTELESFEVHRQYNVPRTTGSFFGREQDVENILKLFESQSLKVLSIHGPPAFGKSTLAMKVGEELFKRHRTNIVRYVDIETTDQSWYLCTYNTSFSSGDSKSHAIQKSVISTNSEHREPNLCEWSQSLKQQSVLILDNCDHILESEKRTEFVRVISDHLEQGSTNNLSIIITSQEKLQFTSRTFKSWLVRELTKDSSMALLHYYVPQLSVEYAANFSRAVGGCPLALKVIGKLLEEQDVEYFRYLLRQVEERTVRTISEQMTDPKETFSEIMDVAYGHLNPITQNCSKLISLFPGTFSAEIGSAIVTEIIDSSCIQNVLLKSLADEKFIGSRSYYTMHKLIRKYFEAKLTRNSTGFNQSAFNTSFKHHYSNYLTNFMIEAYQQQTVSEEDEYRFVYLENHNVRYLATIFSNTTVRVLNVNEVISLGYFIHKDIIISSEWHRFDEVFSLNKHAFYKLCTIYTDHRCTHILWRTFHKAYETRCTQTIDGLCHLIPSRFCSRTCSSLFQCNSVLVILVSQRGMLLELTETVGDSKYHQHVLNKLVIVSFNCQIIIEYKNYNPVLLIIMFISTIGMLLYLCFVRVDDGKRITFVTTSTIIGISTYIIADLFIYLGGLFAGILDYFKEHYFEHDIVIIALAGYCLFVPIRYYIPYSIQFFHNLTMLPLTLFGIIRICVWVILTNDHFTSTQIFSLLLHFVLFCYFNTTTTLLRSIRKHQYTMH